MIRQIIRITPAHYELWHPRLLQTSTILFVEKMPELTLMLVRDNLTTVHTLLLFEEGSQYGRLWDDVSDALS